MPLELLIASSVILLARYLLQATSWAQQVCNTPGWYGAGLVVSVLCRQVIVLVVRGMLVAEAACELKRVGSDSRQVTVVGPTSDIPHSTAGACSL